MRLHGRFEWDIAKARRNLRKHGVSFDDAARVLADDDGERHHVEDYDDADSMEEDRWITTGRYPGGTEVVLRVVWTEREDEGGPITRIISARVATPREREAYEEQVRRR